MNDIILSIYIPTYNRAEKIVSQLKFLLNEIEGLDKKKIEIVVNDNCSTDHTREAVLNCIRGTGIIYHRNEHNLGIDGNIYASVQYVTGKHLWIIGDDDIFEPGAVRRVWEILNTYPDVSYVFLNYSDLAEPKKLAYNGPSGEIEDGGALMTGSKVDQIGMVFLISANIYTTEAFRKTVEILPIDIEEEYGVNGYASLASMQMGKAYFDTKVWLHNDSGNMSWRDIMYQSNMGVLRMFRKLSLIGYNRKQISTVYRSWITGALVAGKILYRFTITKDLKRFIKDTMFCFSKAPWNVITIYWKLIINKVICLFQK